MILDLMHGALASLVHDPDNFYELRPWCWLLGHDNTIIFEVFRDQNGICSTTGFAYVGIVDLTMSDSISIRCKT